jgi:hypothetical protein
MQDQITQLRQELEQQRKMCLYFSEQADVWFKKWQRYHNKLVHAKLLLHQLKPYIEKLQRER